MSRGLFDNTAVPRKEQDYQILPGGGGGGGGNVMRGWVHEEPVRQCWLA